MASKALKGLTIKIGGDTSELTKALDKVDKQSRNLSSELGQINKLLKLDPSNTELLAQKQKVLAEAISNTEDRLDTLKKAEQEVQEQFERGEVSEEQYRALQREIIATEKKLDGYKKAAKETDKAVKDLGDETKKTGDDVEDLGEEAEDAESGVEKLGEALKGGLAVGLGAVAAATVGAIAGIKSVVEETAEYRNAMGKLDTAFQTNGHSSEAATETYKELQSVLGETDQAVEAAAFIAKLTDKEEDLSKWTNIATGVYGAFGASLPIEGLTEAANETAKVGQVTGPLADALNWAAQEGETFGVTLKENIDFTKLSEKQLKRLTKSQRAEYEARKAQYEEIEAYNNSVLEAASAEDMFNIALANCATEQERQTLIMDTLNSMYSESADHYRETNKEVIAQNKATEKLNSAWAKIGKKAAPIVTTFTEGVAELVETFFELIEDVDLEPFLKTMQTGFKKVSKDVLPKLIDALEWCIENFDLLKSVAIGFITALATQKILTFANTVKTTLVSALKSGTAGFKAMDAAAKANVYIALTSAIVGVAAAISTQMNVKLDEMKKRAREAALEAHGLTDAQIEMTERVKESAEALREQREAMDESINGTVAQFGYLGSLKDELFKLAGAQGKVAEQDRARAQFIINELSEKLGIEIEMVDGVILKYDELKGSIEDVLNAKKTELLLADSEGAYIAAIKNKKTAEDDYYSAVKAYQDAKIQLTEQEKAAEEALAKFREENPYWDEQTARAYGMYKLEQEEAVKALEENLGKAESAYNESKGNLQQYYTTIGQYETASRLSLEGNTAEAARVLADRGYYMEKYADQVGWESDEIMNAWELETATAREEAGNVKKNWEKGTEGYTEKMVQEAEKGFKDAFGAMDGAYKKANGVGYDFSSGLASGISSGGSLVTSKAYSLMTQAINAAKRAAAINSPSKKMIEVGEYMGEGAEIGLEESTDQVTKAAANQAKSIIDAYDGVLAQDGQRALRQLDITEAAGRQAAQMTAATATSPTLEKILTAIENGQVLTIDSNILVGATAAKMDTALGGRRVLSARGAI